MGFLLLFSEWFFFFCFRFFFFPFGFVFPSNIVIKYYCFIAKDV